MFYTNTGRPLIINSEIIEWDIKSANTSVIRSYGLLPDKKIEKIEKLDKHDRVVAIGNIMRKDKDFSKSLEDKFNEVIKIFMHDNSLDKDIDIISIKRDALFVVNKDIRNKNIGEFILFMKKNTYHSFLYIKPYEFYISDDKIDVKGISDDLLPLHKDGILQLISDIIEICGSSNMDKLQINRYLIDFVNAYKNRELPFEYYREFNNQSKYKCNLFGNEVLLDEIDEIYINQIDITFNYLNIVLPLIRIIIGG